MPGTGLWSRDGKNAYITIRDKQLVSSEAFGELSGSLECTPLDVLNDHPMAQDLMHRLHIHVTALPFKNGSLSGLWHAERLAPFRPFDMAMNGLLVNEQQPLSNESTSIIMAIMVLACRILGIGKQGYISFPNGPEGQAVWFYTDSELVQLFTHSIGSTILAAPELDKFAVIRPPQNVIDSAIDIARAKCRAAIAPGSGESAKKEQPESTENP